MFCKKNPHFSKLCDALNKRNKPLSRVPVKVTVNKLNLQNDNDTKALLHLVHTDKMKHMLMLFWVSLYGAHVPVKNRWKNTGERLEDKMVCAKKSSIVRFYERVEKELVKRLKNNKGRNKLKTFNMSFQTFY